MWLMVSRSVDPHERVDSTCRTREALMRDRIRVARLSYALLAGVLLALACADAALADTDITFESPAVADCAIVTNQYSGITFLATSPENIGPIEKPVSSVLGASAHSPTHSLTPGDCSNEFPYPQASFLLSTTR